MTRYSSWPAGPTPAGPRLLDHTRSSCPTKKAQVQCVPGPPPPGTCLNPTQPSHQGDPGIPCSRSPLACTQPSSSDKAAPAYHTRNPPGPCLLQLQPQPSCQGSSSAAYPTDLPLTSAHCSCSCPTPQKALAHDAPGPLWSTPTPSPAILAGQNQGGPCTRWCSTPQDPTAPTHSNPSCPTRQPWCSTPRNLQPTPAPAPANLQKPSGTYSLHRECSYMRPFNTRRESCSA